MSARVDHPFLVTILNEEEDAWAGGAAVTSIDASDLKNNSSISWNKTQLYELRTMLEREPSKQKAQEYAKKLMKGLFFRPNARALTKLFDKPYTEQRFTKGLAEALSKVADVLPEIILQHLTSGTAAIEAHPVLVGAVTQLIKKQQTGFINGRMMRWERYGVTAMEMLALVANRDAMNTAHLFAGSSLVFNLMLWIERVLKVEQFDSGLYEAYLSGHTVTMHVVSSSVLMEEDTVKSLLAVFVRIQRFVEELGYKRSSFQQLEFGKAVLASMLPFRPKLLARCKTAMTLLRYYSQLREDFTCTNIILPQQFIEYLEYTMKQKDSYLTAEDYTLLWDFRAEFSSKAMQSHLASHYIKATETKDVLEYLYHKRIDKQQGFLMCELRYLVETLRTQLDSPHSFGYTWLLDLLVRDLLDAEDRWSHELDVFGAGLLGDELADVLDQLHEKGIVWFADIVIRHTLNRSWTKTAMLAPHAVLEHVVREVAMEPKVFKDDALRTLLLANQAEVLALFANTQWLAGGMLRILKEPVAIEDGVVDNTEGLLRVLQIDVLIELYQHGKFPSAMLSTYTRVLCEWLHVMKQINPERLQAETTTFLLDHVVKYFMICEGAHDTDSLEKEALEVALSTQAVVAELGAAVPEIWTSFVGTMRRKQQELGSNKRLRTK